MDYGCFSSGEVRILATAVEDKIVDILSDPHGTYSWAGSTRYPYILGAWTAYRYDQKLSEDQRNTLRRFFDPLYNVLKAPGMPYLMDPEKQEWVMDKQLINDASQIIFESLERLKQ